MPRPHGPTVVLPAAEEDPPARAIPEAASATTAPPAMETIQRSRLRIGSPLRAPGGRPDAGPGHPIPRGRETPRGRWPRSVGAPEFEPIRCRSTGRTPTDAGGAEPGPAPACACT